MATYNGFRYLSQQLDSIQQQTYSELEIVVSDDGSTDSTYRLLEEAAEKDPRIRILAKHSRKGFAKNFEWAMRHCQGDIIALADQDDFWFPNRIERMLSAIGDSHAVACDAEIADASLRIVGKRLSMHMRTTQSALSFEQLVQRNAFPGCTLLVRRELVERVIPFPSVLPHDWWLVLCAVATGGMTYLAEPLMYYRQHDSNTIGLFNNSPSKQTHNRTRETRRLVVRRFLQNRVRREARHLSRFAVLMAHAQRADFDRRSIKHLKEAVRFHFSFFLGPFRLDRLAFALRRERNKRSGRSKLLSVVSRSFGYAWGCCMPQTAFAVVRRARRAALKEINDPEYAEPWLDS